MSKAAAADSAATTDSVVLIGPVANCAVFERLCREAGVPCTLIDLPDGQPISDTARHALAGSSSVIDARLEHTDGSRNHAEVESSLRIPRDCSCDISPSVAPLGMACRVWTPRMCPSGSNRCRSSSRPDRCDVGGYGRWAYALLARPAIDRSWQRFSGFFVAASPQFLNEAMARWGRFPARRGKRSLSAHVGPVAELDQVR